MKYKPLIATPVVGTQVCINYHTSTLRLRAALWQLDIDHEFYIHANQSLVTLARNEIVERFLATNATHLFFVDYDIGFEPKAFIRLLTAGYDIAAGIYRKREDELSWVVDMDGSWEVRPDGFAERNVVGAGFMCIARHVLEEMRSPHCEPFDTSRVDGKSVPEDFSFCLRWRRMGGSIHVDTRSDLSHHGTKTFRGAFADALVDRCQIREPSHGRINEQAA